MFPLERVSRSAPFTFSYSRPTNCYRPRGDQLCWQVAGRFCWSLAAGSEEGIMSANPYDYALNLLAARAYTTRAMSRKLTQKGFPRDESEATIVRLTESGLLDDEKYAEEFARQRLVVRGASQRRVEQLLAQKGIGREVAKAATDKVIENEEVDTIGSMEKIVQKKLMSMNGLDLAIKRKRLFGLLARKGYEIDDINQVLSHMLL